MKRYRRILYLSLCTLAYLSLGQRIFAQNSIPLGQFVELHPHFNPATIGLDNEFSIRAVHNRQLEGLEGASKSFVLLGDMPLALLGGRHSAGVEMSNETFGLFRDTELVGRYAIRLSLGSSYLQFGIGASIISSIFEGSKVYIPSGAEGLSPTDASLPASDVSGRGFDLQIGGYYYHPRFWLGTSVFRLLSSEIMLDNRYHREHRRTYIVSAGYTPEASGRVFSWTPALLALLDEAGFYRVDARLDTWWYDKFRVGLLYRYNAAVGLSLGICLGKAYLGYQYELPTTALRSASWGNHELLLSYSMPIDLGNKQKAVYKSVRLL